MKKLYLVLVCETPGVTVAGIYIKPKLPDSLNGYSPIYTNKKAAKKDWPRKEIREIYAA